jgi:hypothetical protein
VAVRLKVKRIPDAVLRAERSRGLDEEEWRRPMLKELDPSW